MTREEIIQGLKFTIEMFLLEPNTGETLTEPRNDMDKATIDACKGAIELLEQEPKTGHWIEKEHYFEWCSAKCSICGRYASGHSKDTGWEFAYSYTDYCPNCGAKMESEDT